MLVIPAIDIRHGQCVRLYQGRDELKTVYSKDPVEMASFWAGQGARVLHIVDLDGAFQGSPSNLDKVARMKKIVSIPIQMGGGFRSMETIAAAFAAGVDRVVLGTAAVHNPDLVAQAVRQYGKAIAVSIDVSEDFVAVSGWKDISAITFDVLVRKMKHLGVQSLLFTDTRKDGTLSGPNLGAIQLFLQEAVGTSVIASGGITTADDLWQLKELEPLGLDGVIIGKALYDQKITLQEAIQVAGS